MGLDAARQKLKGLFSSGAARRAARGEVNSGIVFGLEEFGRSRKYLDEMMLVLSSVGVNVAGDDYIKAVNQLLGHCYHVLRFYQRQYDHEYQHYGGAVTARLVMIHIERMKVLKVCRDACLLALDYLPRARQPADTKIDIANLSTLKRLYMEEASAIFDRCPPAPAQAKQWSSLFRRRRCPRTLPVQPQPVVPPVQPQLDGARLSLRFSPR